MMKNEVVNSELLGDMSLNVAELALASGTDPDWIITRVEAALIVARDGEPDSWRFGSADLRRARRLAGAERTFEINEDAAAYIVDLLEEIDRLRQCV